MATRKWDVWVHLTSEQVDAAGDSHVLTQHHRGLMYATDESRYLVVEELDPPVTTVYKIHPHSVAVSRTGSITSSQQFRAGEWDHYAYKLPEGTLNFKSFTRSVSSRFQAGDGRLALEYEVWLDKSLVGEFNLQLEIVKDKQVSHDPSR